MCSRRLQHRCATGSFPSWEICNDRARGIDRRPGSDLWHSLHARNGAFLSWDKVFLWDKVSFSEHAKRLGVFRVCEWRKFWSLRSLWCYSILPVVENQWNMEKIWLKTLNYDICCKYLIMLSLDVPYIVNIFFI